MLKMRRSTLIVPMMAPNGTRFGGWLLNTADNDFGMAADFDGDERAESLVTSPWGIGLLKLRSGTMTAPMMAPNGTRFGGWLLNTADNQAGTAADFDGDRAAELCVTSPWGIGILKQAGASMTSPTMAANGSVIGSWRLDSLADDVGHGD
jgi:hypothetical protein